MNFTPRGHGYLVDPIDDRDLHFGIHVDTATTPPPSFSLDELVLSVLDQGQAGSCVANAIAQSLRMRHVAQGVVAPELAARLFLYRNGRHISGDELVDSGTWPRNVLKGASAVGFCSEKTWPYSDKLERVIQQPSWEALREAIDQRAPLTYGSITSTGNARLLDVKRAIAGGFPVVFGVEVSAAFCRGDFNPREPLKPPSTEASEGGHSMTITRYDGDKFRVVNSWSKDFGQDGFVWFSPEYVMAATDLRTIQHAPREGEV